MNTVEAGIFQASKKRRTAITIHSYTVAHALAAAALAQTAIGDEFTLTLLTIAMINTIVKINGGKWGKAAVASFLGVVGGTYLGTRLLVFGLKWIPFLGNGINALSTTITTELLGWAAYALLSTDQDPENLSDSQKEEILQMAKKLQQEEHKEGTGRKLYNSMSREDKNAIDDLFKSMRKSKSDEQQEEISLKILKILEKYA